MNTGGLGRRVQQESTATGPLVQGPGQAIASAPAEQNRKGPIQPPGIWLSPVRLCVLLPATLAGVQGTRQRGIHYSGPIGGGVSEQACPVCTVILAHGPSVDQLPDSRRAPVVRLDPAKRPRRFCEPAPPAAGGDGPAARNSRSRLGICRRPGRRGCGTGCRRRGRLPARRACLRTGPPARHTHRHLPGNRWTPVTHAPAQPPQAETPGQSYLDTAPLLQG